jgi:hypothetical protein
MMQVSSKVFPKCGVETEFSTQSPELGLQLG